MNNVSLERWKDVVGYEEYYQVSDKGRVKSKDREVWNGSNFVKRKGKILKLSLTTTGYPKVELTKNSERRSMRIHRLQAQSFIPNPKNKPNVNHIDGNPKNNNLSNLEWCTQSENLKHAYDIGLMKKTCNKIKRRVVDEYIKEKKSSEEISKTYNISKSSVLRFVKEYGYEARDNSYYRNIYNIDRSEMIRLFEEGLSNKEIARELKTNNTLIATYRYKYKKGELII